jgi:hypothetical protein
VPVGGSFTPTSALVAALQAQGANVAPRAPLFFGVRPPGKSQRQDDPGRMVMLQVRFELTADPGPQCLSTSKKQPVPLRHLKAGPKLSSHPLTPSFSHSLNPSSFPFPLMPASQMHDPNNLMRTSGFVSVQHPVEHGMMSAFYTPQPALSAQHLRTALEEAAAKLYRGGERAQGRGGQELSRRSRERGRVWQFRAAGREGAEEAQPYAPPASASALSALCPLNLPCAVYPPGLEKGRGPSSSNAYASPDSIHTVGCPPACALPATSQPWLPSSSVSALLLACTHNFPHFLALSACNAPLLMLPDAPSRRTAAGVEWGAVPGVWLPAVPLRGQGAAILRGATCRVFHGAGALSWQACECFRRAGTFKTQITVN